MTPQEFCYWLQGLLELQPDLKTLNEAQVQMIRDHLGYVFTHVQQTRPAPASTPAPFDIFHGVQTLSQIDPTRTVAIC